MDEFIRGWRARLSGALDEALAHLVSFDENPWSDGVLGDWVRQLRTFSFEERHVPAIVALIGKPDPHLQEAGVELAAAALGWLDCSDQVELAIARLFEGRVDSWVLQSIVELLRSSIGPLGPQFISVYRALVRYRPAPASPGHRFIMRNRHIDPLRELDQLYEQHALQTIEPTERDRLLLPILEARYQTRGWRPTQEAILRAMGLDPAHHFKVLRGRP